MRGGGVVILLLTQMGELREYEASLVDFDNMGEAVESIVECIHKMAMREFLSRSLESMWDWELRTKNMFINNHLYRIEDIATLPVGKVNRLVGCGYTTRKEVYDVFEAYHLRLKFWNPDRHYSKMNYKF
jgi:hypothetical protein